MTIVTLSASAGGSSPSILYKMPEAWLRRASRGGVLLWIAIGALGGVAFSIAIARPDIRAGFALVGLVLESVAYLVSYPIRRLTQPLIIYPDAFAPLRLPFGGRKGLVVRLVELERIAKMELPGHAEEFFRFVAFARDGRRYTIASRALWNFERDPRAMAFIYHWFENARLWVESQAGRAPVRPGRHLAGSSRDDQRSSGPGNGGG